MTDSLPTQHSKNQIEHEEGSQQNKSTEEHRTYDPFPIQAIPRLEQLLTFF